MNTASRKILFLAANPKDTGRLRLDQELRDIGEGLKRSRCCDRFTLEQRMAARPRDVQRAMLDLNPQMIHFSGHGTGEAGLMFEDVSGNAQLVSSRALAGLFGLFAERVQCVLLNGCYSEAQAKAIVEHIPYVIGMNRAIGDRSAIAFSVGFYDALGAGRDIEFAYKLGCNAIQMEAEGGARRDIGFVQAPAAADGELGEDVGEHLIPVLLKRSHNSPTATVKK